MRKNKLYMKFTHPPQPVKLEIQKNQHKSGARVWFIIYNDSHITESVYITNFPSLIIKVIKQPIPHALYLHVSYYEFIFLSLSQSNTLFKHTDLEK